MLWFVYILALKAIKGKSIVKCLYIKIFFALVCLSVSISPHFSLFFADVFMPYLWLYNCLLFFLLCISFSLILLALCVCGWGERLLRIRVGWSLLQLAYRIEINITYKNMQEEKMWIRSGKALKEKYFLKCLLSVFRKKFKFTLKYKFKVSGYKPFPL